MPFEVDGELEASSNRIFGTGTFFGQTGSLDGTRARIIEGKFQVLDDGESISTFDVSGRVAWEWLTSERLTWGAFVGGAVSRTDVDRALSGAAEKTGLSFGTYVVVEPVDRLYVDGFLSVGAGRNELSLGDEELEIEGEYATRSFLMGGAVSGMIERERFELRPELSVANGATSFGDIDLEASAFGMTKGAKATVDDLSHATMRLTPEILVPLKLMSTDATLVVAPSLVCAWTNSEAECGGGFRQGLRGTSRDGLTNWNVSVATDRTGDAVRTGVATSFQLRF